MDVVRFWFISIGLFFIVLVFGTVGFGCIIFLELDLHIVWRSPGMGLFIILEEKPFCIGDLVVCRYPMMTDKVSS